MNPPDKQGPDSHDGQDEHDIDQLFKQQKITVPVELDNAILTQAEYAPEGIAVASKFSPANRRITQWFAVAATVVIGISVAPLVLRAPDSALQLDAPAPNYNINDNNSMAEADENRERFLEPAEEPAEESAAITSSARVSEEMAATSALRRKVNAAESLVRKEVPMPTQSAADSEIFTASEVDAAASQQPLITQDSLDQGGSSGDNLVQPIKTSPSTNSDAVQIEELQTSKDKAPPHRANTTIWIAHIRDLLAKGESKKAEKELALFNEAHPDADPALTLEFRHLNPSQHSETRPHQPDD